MALAGLLLLLWLAINTPPVQNWLVRKITQTLSGDLKTSIRIERVDFSLFNTMNLEGVLVKDLGQDTLLYAGTLSVRINDWFFLKDHITLHYAGLKDVTVQLNREDSVWNYAFLVDYFSGGKQQSKSKVEFQLKDIELESIHVIQRDGWRGEDQEFRIGRMLLHAKAFSLSQKKVHISKLLIESPYFAITNYEGNRPDSLRPREVRVKIKNDTAHLRWNPGRWSVVLDKLDLAAGTFRTLTKGHVPSDPYFDGSNIDFHHINARFTDVRLREDSILAVAELSTAERSGLKVESLKARIRFHPEAMEFRQLDLRTPKSHLHDYFAMRFATFDDLGYFLSRVTLEGDFNNATLHSDDIACFAPELRNWNTQISVRGKVSGTIENLHANNLIVQAGNNTFLDGNIRMNGLPDINKTFIDFEANSFRTTWQDAVTILPKLKKMTQPRLDRLEYLRFRGNFAGFLNDFVTYGTIETRIGTVVSDLNMKIRPNDKISYYGTLQTKGLDLGKLLDIPRMGAISFKGTVQGSGLRASNIVARLNGDIEKLDVNAYTYQNLKIDGNVANRKFNGRFIADDPNLNVYLNGLIDFSTPQTRIDIEAGISRVHFRSLNLARENIDFSGKLRFDFTGSHIDDFYGKARITDASLMHDGLKLPFDSLSLVSENNNGTKLITIVSNEFDAAMAGEFSLKGLQQVSRNFLHRYFPSYIPATTGPLAPENFDFVITTKNVQDYLHIFSEGWKGFNYSAIEGRVNTRDNILDLNVNIPQFNYYNTAFYELSLQGKGNLSNLTVQSNIGNVLINDSLNFPGTVISVTSANDSSSIFITTSANQTLNSANLDALVVTRKNGISINFRESTFDVNGKKWTIQENGELILTKELVSAEGLRISNEQQEIRIRTAPSDITNTNDLKIELQKINIGDFAPYIITSNRLEGLLSGTVDIADPLGNMQVDVSAVTDQFRLDDDSIGQINLAAYYNVKKGILSFGGNANNLDYQFDLKGFYNLRDTTSNKQLDMTISLERAKIDLLKMYLSEVFSNVTGYANGTLRLVGPPNKLNLLGQATLSDGKVTVDYTNVTYNIPKAEFTFRDDRIDFGSFLITDTLGNTGMVTKGLLYHRSFNAMSFDFAINTSKLLALNTNNLTKDPFYGTIVAKASLTLNGPLEDMVMSVKGQPADSSQFYIRSGDSRQSGQADYIVWKTYGREMQEQFQAKSSKLTLLMDITANNLVQMNVIIDELTNDVMSAIGHGNLKIKASTAGEFEMTGQVDIDRGNYNFNFQSLLRKPFKLTSEAGSYLRWNGDPYNADIKVTAEYKADNVKFSDLGDQLYLQTGGDVAYIKKFRGEINVIAYLTGQLMQPDIRFKIEMPNNSPLRNDPLVNNLLNRIQNDANELNKQVAFLIIFNSFGPLTTSSQATLGSQAWEGIVSSSISGFISNQLSKQFSTIFRKIFNDESIKVNFNAQLYNGAYLLNNATTTSNLGIDRTSLNFTLAKSMFEERLTFTFGSAFDFGLTSAQAKATNNLQFLPDITAEWKLRPDGKLLMTLFYRDSYNYQSISGKQNRSGAGISFRRDFERFSELWRNERKKKKAKSAEENDPNPGPETTKANSVSDL